MIGTILSMFEQRPFLLMPVKTRTHNKAFVVRGPVVLHKRES